MASIPDRFIDGTAKAFGWSRDFTADLLGTAGGGAIAYYVAGFLLPGPPVIATVAACVVSAMLWKRSRRDNN